MLTFGIKSDIIIIENKGGIEMKKIEELKFSLEEKEKSLKSLNLSTFELKEDVYKLINEIEELKELIKVEEDK